MRGHRKVPPAADDAAVRQQRQGEEADNTPTARANDGDDDDDDEGANITAVGNVARGETAFLPSVPEDLDWDARCKGVASGSAVPVLTANGTVAYVRHVGVDGLSTFCGTQKTRQKKNIEMGVPVFSIVRIVRYYCAAA